MIYALVFIVGLMLLWVFGPRVPLDLTIRTFDLPADLDGYLKASEARFTDIVPNTEKTIL